MSNLAITYRPKTFDEVYGHEITIEGLKKRAKDKNWPKVIMLSGPTGIGKTTIARIISKSILCQDKNDEGEGCGVCETCKAIDEGRGINTYYEYNASNLNIDEVREIGVNAKQSALGLSDNKVFVIDEMQEMTKSKAAMNTFFKILEEPNDISYFILGSMEVMKLPAALDDRAVPYNLRSVEISEIANYLQAITMDKGIKITDKVEEVLMTIAENCHRSVRAGVKYLERAIDSNLWDKKTFIEELGIVDSDAIQDIIYKLFSNDATFIANKIDQKALDTIRFKLTLIFKHKCGVSLNGWEKSQINKTGFKDITIDKLMQVIDILNELLVFPYLSKPIIEANLLKCFYTLKLSTIKVKTPTTTKVETPAETRQRLNGRRRPEDAQKSV